MPEAPVKTEQGGTRQTAAVSLTKCRTTTLRKIKKKKQGIMNPLSNKNAAKMEQQRS